MKRYFALLSLCLFVFGCLSGCIGTTDDPTKDPTDGTLPVLNAVTFSIGKADATLIWTAEHAILIDAGEIEDAAEILRYMQRKGIAKLDAFIITHFDKDHVGGASGIIEGTAIDRIYATYDSKVSAEVDAYRAALTAKSITPTVVREKTAVSYGDIRLVIYPPHEESYSVKESNNSSLAVHMTYGENRFLFAGDAEEIRIAELLTEDGLACDLMKVPYHGNDLENLPALLALCKPTWGIVTCSDKNPEEQGKMTALREADVTVFLSRHGDIEFTSNGKKITVTQ